MTGFLEGKFAAVLAKGFDGKLLKGTLRKVVTSGRDAHGDPITTTSDFDVQGFVDDYSALIHLGAGIPATDSKVVLIAGLCAAAPAIGDHVKFTTGRYAGIWWQARKDGGDPAGGTYELQSFQVTL